MQNNIFLNSEFSILEINGVIYADLHNLNKNHIASCQPVSRILFNIVHTVDFSKSIGKYLIGMKFEFSNCED